MYVANLDIPAPCLVRSNPVNLAFRCASPVPHRGARPERGSGPDRPRGLEVGGGEVVADEEGWLTGRQDGVDGAGRSTRFLEGLGFDVVGVDVSRSMLDRARERDPGGLYVLVADGPDGLSEGLADVVPAGSLDLVLCAFPFDNIPGREKRAGTLGALGRLLTGDGRVVVVASSPELYRHEWLSFTTAAFPENRRAESGDPVRIVMKDVPDARPVPDYLWTDDDYRAMAAAAGLRVLETARPLGREDEPYDWVTETTVAPWAIHVMGRS
jgi:SAM-dependent methyltransferase